MEWIGRGFGWLLFGLLALAALAWVVSMLLRHRRCRLAFPNLAKEFSLKQFPPLSTGRIGTIEGPIGQYRVMISGDDEAHKLIVALQEQAVIIISREKWGRGQRSSGGLTQFSFGRAHLDAFFPTRFALPSLIESITRAGQPATSSGAGAGYRDAATRHDSVAALVAKLDAIVRERGRTIKHLQVRGTDLRFSPSRGTPDQGQQWFAARDVRTFVPLMISLAGLVDAVSEEYG